MPQPAEAVKLLFANINTNDVRLHDFLNLGFLVLIPTLVVIFKQEFPVFLIAEHGAVGFGILILIFWKSPPKPLKWLRDLYTILLFPFFFSEVSQNVTMIFGFWFEPYLIGFDRMMYGKDSWIFVLLNFHPMLIEILAIAYFGFYFFLPFTVFLVYYCSDKREPCGKMLCTAIMDRVACCMYSSYLLFMLMPARAPHNSLDIPLNELFLGGFFYHAVILVQKNSGIVGNSFPSTHVSITWSFYLPLRRHFPIFFYLFTPFVITLTLATFLLQYHYVLDAVGGTLFAIFFDILLYTIERIPQPVARALADGPEAEITSVESLPSSSSNSGHELP